MPFVENAEISEFLIKNSLDALIYIMKTFDTILPSKDFHKLLTCSK